MWIEGGQSRKRKTRHRAGPCLMLQTGYRSQDQICRASWAQSPGATSGLIVVTSASAPASSRSCIRWVLRGHVEGRPDPARAVGRKGSARSEYIVDPGRRDTRCAHRARRSDLEFVEDLWRRFSRGGSGCCPWLVLNGGPRLRSVGHHGLSSGSGCGTGRRFGCCAVPSGDRARQ